MLKRRRPQIYWESMLFPLAFIAVVVFVPIKGLELPKDIQEKLIPDNCVRSAFQVGDIEAPNCTFGVHRKSLTSVEISCPEVGILIVKGDYTVFYIACSSSLPLDFNFDGTTPTEAIDVSFKRLEKQGHGLERFWYRADVKILSNPALFKYYHPNSSITENSFSAAAIIYSRTGSYRFSGFHNRSHISTQLYIFFEEPLLEPSFITNRNTELQVKEGEIRIPCRPTTFNTTVTLFENGRLVQHTSYSPKNGFSILRAANSINSSTNFSCNLVDGKRTLTIDIPLKRSRSLSITVFQHGAPFISSDLQPRGFGFWTYSLISCQITDVTGAFNETPTLAAIGHTNPSMVKLRRAFVFPIYRNRSYSLEVGKRDIDLRDHFVIQREIPQETVSVYCGTDSEHTTTSISKTVDGKTFTFTYDADWSLIERKWLVQYRFFELHLSSPSEILYENTEVQFTCAVSTFSIIQPTIWYVEYRNGSMRAEAHDYNWINGTSYFNKTLTLDVRQVVCAASMWNINDWRNTSLNVIVQRCEGPDFDNETSTFNYHLFSKTFIKCSASGHPQPEVYLERYGQPVTNKSLGFALLEFPSANSNHSGVYTCVAVNCGGKKMAKKNFTLVVIDEFRNELLSKMLSTENKSIAKPTVPQSALMLLVMFLIILGLICRNRYKRKQGGLTISEISHFMSGTGTFLTITDDTRTDALEMNNIPHSIPYDGKLEIPHKRFQIDKTCLLGSGEYGKVYKGLLDGKPVAVKTVKDEEDPLYLNTLLSELKVMMYMGDHTNLITLLGAYTKHLIKGKAYVFVDYCSLGSLNSYLKKGRSQIQTSVNGAVDLMNVCNDFTLKEMYAWSAQIASGMAYLSEKKVIHGDLATRNVLLTETRKAKITDFGLSRRLYDYAEYVRRKEERVPWRWLAPESMKHLIFSCQSDIWSYGITIWEIFSLAKVPYHRSSWGIAFITQIESGTRLPKPEYASQELYDKVMMKCWNAEPSLRPSFENIADLVTSLCSSVKGTSGYVPNNILFANSQIAYADIITDTSEP